MSTMTVKTCPRACRASVLKDDPPVLNDPSLDILKKSALFHLGTNFLGNDLGATLCVVIHVFLVLLFYFTPNTLAQKLGMSILIFNYFHS